MKKFLMATDLSARSDRALERAMRLSQEHDAELTIVHAVNDGLPASVADAQEKVAKQTIQEHVGALSTGNGPRVSIEVVFGKAYVSILELSEKINAELIILGMHREDAFKDMFRGTTAERVIRAGDVPVLLVKDRIRGPYHRIMIGIDFSAYSRRAFEFAVQFVQGGELYLVHAYHIPFRGLIYGHDTQREMSKQHQSQFEQMVEDDMEVFLASFGTKPPKVERIMQEGIVLEVIHRQVRQLRPDLVVVGTHGRTGVAHALLGSTAEDLLRDPPTDVLAVKAW